MHQEQQRIKKTPKHLKSAVFPTESPLQFYVNHTSSPNVTAYGPGLSYGVANKVAKFTVFTDDASEGTTATGETGRRI